MLLYESEQAHEQRLLGTDIAEAQAEKCLDELYRRNVKCESVYDDVKSDFRDNVPYLAQDTFDECVDDQYLHLGLIKFRM